MDGGNRKKKKKDKVVRALDFGSGMVSFFAVMLAIVLILYSGYVLYDSMAIEVSAFSSNSDLLKYKPSVMGQVSEAGSLADINPDYRSWITVEGEPASPIDYPVVQGKDNLYYASHDATGKISLSGAIYLAAETKTDFSDSYNLLSGHHMDNGAMFGSLDKFKDKDYFKAHSTATVVTAGGLVYDVTFFALVSTDAYETRIYNGGDRLSDVLNFLRGSRDKDVGVGTKVLVSDWTVISGMKKMIALSTCASADTNGRLVLFGKMSLTNKPAPTRTSGGGGRTTPSPTPEDMEPVKLTVKYIADGTEAFPDQVFIHTPGDSYYVVSPQLPGYDVDIQIVRGTIWKDMTVIVRYIPKAWTVTIRYIYPDGTEAAPTYRATVKTGESYSVTSPVIEGWKTLRLRIDGTNPGRNEQYTVIYIPDYFELRDLPMPLGLEQTFMQEGVCFE